MKIRKLVCFVMVLSCCLITFAHAESYKIMDIYDGKINTDEIVFKSGDAITGGSGISFDVLYLNANGEQVDKGKGKIKSVTLNGDKCSEWKLDGYSGSVIKIGSLVRGVFELTMKPLFAFADKDGYYLMSSATYGRYTDNAGESLGMKVKLSGRVTEVNDDAFFVSVGDSSIVAVKSIANSVDYSAEVGDNILCRGEVTDYILYNETEVPTINCVELNKVKYEPLQKNDKGANVLQMKERLRELGYFKATADLSDAYNDTCVERVKLFQEQNGISATGIADAETLALLYSDVAKTQ